MLFFSFALCVSTKLKIDFLKKIHKLHFFEISLTKSFFFSMPHGFSYLAPGGIKVVAREMKRKIHILRKRKKCYENRKFAEKIAKLGSDREFCGAFTNPINPSLLA